VSSPPALTIRPAQPDDAPLLLTLIKELADYEHLSELVTATAEDIRESLFGARPVAEAVIAESDGQTAGFALFFHNFSTFLGRPGLYLEDLYVKPAFRGNGVGKSLLLHVIGLAHQRRCGRVEWAVLDWNTPAIEFYKGLGAVPMDQWRLFRLTADRIESLARNEGLVT